MKTKLAQNESDLLFTNSLMTNQIHLNYKEKIN